MPPLAKVVMQDDTVVVGARRLLVEDALDVKTGSFPLLVGALAATPELMSGDPFDIDTGVIKGRGNVSLVILGDGS